jgi:hypothetical protein
MRVVVQDGAVTLEWSDSAISAAACRMTIAYLDRDRAALEKQLADVPPELYSAVARRIGSWVDAIHDMVAPAGFGWGGDLDLLHRLVQDALEPMVTGDTATFALQRLDEIDQSRFVDRVPASSDDRVELHLAAAYAVALASKVIAPGEFRQTLVLQLIDEGQQP